MYLELLQILDFKNNGEWSIMKYFIANISDTLKGLKHFLIVRDRRRTLIREPRRHGWKHHSHHHYHPRHRHHHHHPRSVILLENRCVDNCGHRLLEIVRAWCQQDTKRGVLILLLDTIFVRYDWLHYGSWRGLVNSRNFWYFYCF